MADAAKRLFQAALRRSAHEGVQRLHSGENPTADLATSIHQGVVDLASSLGFPIRGSDPRGRPAPGIFLKGFGREAILHKLKRLALAHKVGKTAAAGAAQPLGDQSDIDVVVDAAVPEEAAALAADTQMTEAASPGPAPAPEIITVAQLQGTLKWATTGQRSERSKPRPQGHRS